jgi:hypothetical protein
VVLEERKLDGQYLHLLTLLILDDQRFRYLSFAAQGKHETFLIINYSQ